MWFYWKRLESGERILDFRAITLDRPSIRELPNRLAWEKTIVPGDSMNGWKPFFDPLDAEEVSPFYKGEKRNGRPCLNVARVAGFIESFAYKPATGNEKNDCLYIALRQTENPDESLPIRLYGRFTEAYKKQIQISLPIFIEGFYRVKKENRGTAENPILTPVPYIFCSKIKVATPEEIKVRPEWWLGMKDRLLRMSKDRIAASKETHEKKSELPNATPPGDQKNSDLKPMEPPKPPETDSDLDDLQ